ncbi:MAG: type II toxin-antitoxin system HicB family antitoxin [Ignavibacteriales bacterium]|nr:type II toxin-antitoxin system HicB family antitoxin [Ignavibacteriales bacterium]
MKKNINYYLALEYPMQIERMEDGMYCVSIPLLKGCKAYASSVPQAFEELLGVKETLFELMMEQGKQIPEPSVRLEIPVNEFRRMASRKRLNQFVVSEV